MAPTLKPKQENDSKKVEKNGKAPAVENKSKSKEPHSQLRTESHQRRNGKKYMFSVFYARPKVTTRPRTFLRAQEKSLGVMHSKMLELEKEKGKQCRIKVMYTLESFEDELVKRLGMVRNLKLDPEDDELVLRAHTLSSNLEEKVMGVQNMQCKKQMRLDVERKALKRKHSVFICCKICEQQESKT